MEKFIIHPHFKTYAISNYGTVINVRNNRIVTQYVGERGYKIVQLSNGRDNRKNFVVHRLVGMLHMTNPEGKPYINHKDGNKQNNHISNLEWCTAKENDNHARKMGLKGHSGLSNDNKPVRLTHIESGEVFVFETSGEASRFLNTNNGSLNRVLKGKRNKHKGFIAEYV